MEKPRFIIFYYIVGVLLFPLVFMVGNMKADNTSFYFCLILYYLGVWNCYAFFENKLIIIGYGSIKPKAEKNTRRLAFLLNFLVMGLCLFELFFARLKSYPL